MRPRMTKARVNRLAAVVPLVLSGLAFAIAVANVMAGVPPQPDEGTSAHIWQLLMAAQLPVIILFVATADWKRGSTPALVGAQAVGFAIACVPVWVAGY